jgi:hypothetical protein
MNNDELADIEAVADELVEIEATAAAVADEAPVEYEPEVELLDLSCPVESVAEPESERWGFSSLKLSATSKKKKGKKGGFSSKTLPAL